MDQISLDLILSTPGQPMLISVILEDAEHPFSGDIVELEQILIDAKRAYYQTGETLYSDRDFDTLEDTLRELKPDSCVITGIGLLDAPKTESEKFVHKNMMGSPSKIKTDADLDKFLNIFDRDEKFVITPKLDGISCAIHYENGQMKKAVTRGDGEVGEDITHNILVVHGVPHKLQDKFTGEVRGELIMKTLDFDRVNSELDKNGKKIFANARNATSGSISQKDSSICASRHISFIAYNVPENDLNISTYNSLFEWLMEQQFETPQRVCCLRNEVRHNIGTRDHWRGLTYSIDGVVVHPDNMSHVSLGWNDKRPRWTIAWKWESESTTAKVTGIKWFVGKTGKITPVIDIEPVNLSGAKISNVTGYNAKFIIDFLISIGTIIRIQRSGEVIPKCIGRVGGSESIPNIPTHCPSCSSKLEYDGIQLYCNNVSCEAKTISRLLLFVKKTDMKGFGEAIVTELFENGIVRKTSDFFNMVERFDIDTIAMAVGGHGTLANLETTIQKRKNTPIIEADLLSAIGIDGASDGTSKRIMEIMDLKSLLTLHDNDESWYQRGEMKLNVKDIGWITYVELVNGLTKYRQEIEELMAILTIDRPSKIEGSLSGKTFCITGTLTKKRDVVEKIIESNGGKIAGVKKDPNFYLVTGEDCEGSSKFKKAESIGANMISEQQLINMCNHC